MRPAAAKTAPQTVTLLQPHRSAHQVAMGPVISGTAWNIETTPAVAALELENSCWNCSNMIPKLKVTPSAIMLTKNEAATTSQP